MVGFKELLISVIVESQTVCLAPSVEGCFQLLDVLFHKL